MATVLVVDDEPDVLLTVRRALEADGHEVVLASDGRMALARVDDRAVDAVVLDLRMPVLDGLAVLEGLGGLEAAPPVVVLLPGPGSVDDARRALDLGAVAFETKPLELDRLRAAVAAVLSLDGDDARTAHRQQAARALDELE